MSAAADEEDLRLVTVRKAPALYLGKPGATCKENQLLNVVRRIAEWIVKNVSYDVETWEESRNTEEPLVSSSCGKKGTLHNCVRTTSHGDFMLCKATNSEPGKQALIQRKATCRGYSDLFCLLCRNAGIEAVKIPGIVKTSCYVPGDVIKPILPNHEWNAVRLRAASGWHLIDLTWAAGHIDRKSGDFRSDFNPHFLFTNPRDLVRDHLPMQSKWQLLYKPLTMKAFQKDLLLRPGYFHLGIIRCSTKSGSIHCVSETTTVTLHLTQPLCFTYTLLQSSTGNSVNQCVSLEWTSSQCTVKIYFPKPGPYVLRLYARARNGPMRQVLVQSLHSYWVGSPQDPQTGMRPLLLWGLTRHSESIGLLVPDNFNTRLTLSKSGFITSPLMTFTSEVHITAMLWPYKASKCFGKGRMVFDRVINAGRTVCFRLNVAKKGRNPCTLWRLALFAKRSWHEHSNCFCNCLLVVAET